MKQIIEITPSYDKRNKDPKKNYGIHGCDLRIVLKGELGAVQFVMFTNWFLPEIIAEGKVSIHGEYNNWYIQEPMAADIGYHSPKPMYDNQKPMDTNKTGKKIGCEHLDGKPCYYDGSGLQAEEYKKILIKEGTEGLWKSLEEYYKDTFGELK